MRDRDVILDWRTVSRTIEEGRDGTDVKRRMRFDQSIIECDSEDEKKETRGSKDNSRDSSPSHRAGRGPSPLTVSVAVTGTGLLTGVGTVGGEGVHVSDRRTTTAGTAGGGGGGEDSHLLMSQRLVPSRPSAPRRSGSITGMMTGLGTGTGTIGPLRYGTGTGTGTGTGISLESGSAGAVAVAVVGDTYTDTLGLSADITAMVEAQQSAINNHSHPHNHTGTGTATSTDGAVGVGVGTVHVASSTDAANSSSSSSSSGRGKGLKKGPVSLKSDMQLLIDLESGVRRNKEVVVEAVKEQWEREREMKQIEYNNGCLKEHITDITASDVTQHVPKVCTGVHHKPPDTVPKPAGNLLLSGRVAKPLPVKERVTGATVFQ